MTEIVDLMTVTHKALRVLAEDSVRRHGLHLGQNLVLAALWEQEGRTPGELAALLNVTTPTVVKMATRMTAAGLLTRQRDEHDQRLVRLYLTDKGRALQGPLTADRQELERQITEGLTREELKQLSSTLAKVLANARHHGSGKTTATDEH
ncbi:MarR family winged helix-turn-helix transcriptional regulator [Nonomuraea sp. NPDC050536]|uniref:MarR family winged helix-turn-helix transcriptional regulator n=1 Tax=Nonomuraea sp. NPDC050536 TaxID=3364366 RepID=UPI0037CAA7A6